MGYNTQGLRLVWPGLGSPTTSRRRFIDGVVFSHLGLKSLRPQGKPMRKVQLVVEVATSNNLRMERQQVGEKGGWLRG